MEQDDFEEGEILDSDGDDQKNKVVIWTHLIVLNDTHTKQ